jgi:uncharacterized membrane protein
MIFMVGTLMAMVMQIFQTTNYWHGIYFYNEAIDANCIWKIAFLKMALIGIIQLFWI